MKTKRAVPVYVLAAALFLSSCASKPTVVPAATRDAQERAPWRGVHLMVPAPEALPLVKRAITEQLAPLGVNVIVLEVNYRFAFQSHPELRMEPALTRSDARALAAHCRPLGIRLIPLFNCLGHQSWAKSTFTLLTQYPEFDETPQIPRDNPNIYCRSWCPQHPRVNEIAFALMDELIEAFDADALHVGMDEVFLLGSDQCARCRGQDPAALFAKAVTDYHRHLVGRKQVTMLLWGDRLLDDRTMKYGEWESSRNGTAPAIDHIPKDIVVCDWHYEQRESYPSVPYFQQQGFRVWPSSWRNREAALALLEDSARNAQGRMLGHLCTTWSGSEAFARVLLNEGTDPPKQTQEIVAATRACLERLQPARPAATQLPAK